MLKGLFIGGAFVVVLLSVGYLECDRFWEGEFYFLLLASALGAVVMASSRDLITIFVALELVTGPTFLMAGWRKGDATIERGGAQVLHHRRDLGLDPAVRHVAASTASPVS